MHTVCHFVRRKIIFVRPGLHPARAFSWQVELRTGQTPPSLCLHIKCGSLRLSNEFTGWTETFFSGRVFDICACLPCGTNKSCGRFRLGPFASWPPFMSGRTLAWFSVFTQPAVTASSSLCLFLKSGLVLFLFSNTKALMHRPVFVMRLKVCRQVPAHL